MANARLSGGAMRPLALYLVAMAAIFVGERLLGEGHELRFAFAGGGGLLLMMALVAAAARVFRGAGGGQRVASRQLLHYALGAASVGVYAASLPGAPLGEGDVGTVLRVSWPILWLIGTLPATLISLSLRSTADGALVEVRRVLDSGSAGMALALAVSWVVALNYVGDGTDIRFDFRTVKDLTASEATVEMVRNLREPVVVTLFFPPADEVGEVVAPYFDALSQVSEQLVLDRMDRDMFPRRAREMRARKNGTVVVSRGDVHESIALGTDPSRAQRKLKELDKNFRASLSKVTRDQRIAYVVTGHGERSFRPGKDDERAGLKDLRKVLEVLNYKVKKLGLADGLGDAVPDDATLVIVPAPTSPILGAEQRSLVRYFRGGGALLLMVDPDVEAPPELDILLNALGVEVSLTPLAHDARFVTLTRGRGDRRVLYTNRFMAHDSTRTLAKLSTTVNLVFPETGSLRRVDGVEGVRTKTTVRSLAGTWADADDDLEAGPGEARQVFDLVIAAEATDAGGDGRAGRAIITADADVASDMILRLNAGNQQWLVDAVRWLEDEIELSGEVAAVEDVPMLHTRDEDKALFYGTVLAVPMGLFGLGALMWRRRRAGGEG